MHAKSALLAATALATSLFAFDVRPAAADCVTDTSSDQRVVRCTGNTGTTNAGSNVDVFTNEGTISSSSSVALTLGTGIGDVTNSGTIQSTGVNQTLLHGVRIDGMKQGAVFRNSGAISAAGDGASALYVLGAGVVENTGQLTAASNLAPAVRLGSGSTLTNSGVDARIIGGGAGVQMIDDGYLINSGRIEATGGSGIAVLMDNRSLIENAGLISSRYAAVRLGSNSRLVNTGQILGAGAAGVVNMRSGELFNEGVIDASAGGSANPTIILLTPEVGRSARLVNSGTIGSSQRGPDAVAIYAGVGDTGDILVENTGRIWGGLDLSSEGGRRRIANGASFVTGDLTGGIEAIEGNILLSTGDDEILNGGSIIGAIDTGAGWDRIDNLTAGTIVGDIELGLGEDGIYNSGTIEGWLNFGGGSDSLENEVGGVVRGDVFFGGGDDMLYNAGLLDAAVSFAEGADRFILAGRLVRGADLGDGDDTLELRQGQTIADTAVIAGGFGDDLLLATGSMTLDGRNVIEFERFAKTGAGDLTLGGDFDFATSMSVEAGLLHLTQGSTLAGGLLTLEGAYLLDGSHDGDILVRGGLYGDGRIIGDHLLRNAGVIAPGRFLNGSAQPSIGKLTVLGDYTQEANGSLNIELGAPGSNDVLDVSGFAQLGGTIRFVPLDLANVGEYTFLLAAGGIRDTFSNVDGQGLFFNYEVSYAPNSVSVKLSSVTPPPPPPPPLPPPPPPMLEVINGLTPNQAAVRGAFVSRGAFTPDLALVRAELNDIEPERAPAALDSLSGEAYLAAPVSAAVAQSRLARETFERAQRLNGTAPLDGAWAYAFGASDRVDGDRLHSGTRGETTGLVVGADRSVGSNLRLGVVMETSNTDLDQDRTRAEVQLRSLVLGLHGSLTAGPLQVHAAASHGAHQVDAKRRLTTGPNSERVARGETDASGLLLDIAVSPSETAPDGVLSPYVGLSYATIDQDPFRETGAGDAGLNFSETEYRVMTLRAGLAAKWSVDLDGGRRLSFGARVGAGEDLVQEGRTARPELVGGGGRFSIEGERPAKTEISGGAWVSGEVAAGWSLSGSYGFGARSNAFSQTASIGLRYAW